jgi:TM2 domain-containing membrane protein YozV
LAGVLGIICGSLGVHRFYLGYTAIGVVQLGLWIVGFLTAAIGIGVFLILAAGIWGFVDGVMILNGTIKCDANGVPLGA